MMAGPGRPKKNPMAGMTGLKLNLGCGPHKMDGFINIDKSGGDLAIDLEDAALPFDDGSVDLVICSHVLEHIRNLLPLMNEIHRVMKKDGELRISVPVFPSSLAFQDPTHVRYFTEATFNYWVESDELGKVGAGYGMKPFARMHKTNHGSEIDVRMWK